jgi:hypothetical protein
LPRIYFLSSNYDDAGDPTTTLCYWEEGTGIVTVPTNIEYDLGAGFMAVEPDGNVLVTGFRDYHYTGDITWMGSWWEGGTYEQLTEDALLYRLDRDLQNPQVLIRDSLYTGFGTEGWESQFVQDAHGTPMRMPFVDPAGGIVIVGERRRPYVSDADAGEGEVVHRYNAEGSLQSRHWPRMGYSQWEGQPQGWLTTYESETHWAMLDTARGFAYSQGWDTIARYNFNTDTYEWAPRVFPWVQTQMGWVFDGPQNLPMPGQRVRILTGDGRTMSSGYPDYQQVPYAGFIEEKQLWQSRYIDTTALDPATGNIWALVDAYWPYEGEWGVNDGQPGLTTLPSKGGRATASHQWKLICIDPSQLEWYRTFNPWPYSEYPYPDSPPKWRGPTDGPQQAGADVQEIILTEGPLKQESWGGLGHLCHALTISNGKAYYARQVLAPDPSDPLGEQLIAGVFEVDLTTGEQTQLFVDDRLHGDTEYPGYIQNDIFQIVVGPESTEIAAEPGGVRRRFARNV